MKDYVARKGNRWYAVIYEGIDPITGMEVRELLGRVGVRLRARAGVEVGGLDLEVGGLGSAVQIVDVHRPAEPVPAWGGTRRCP